jgi:hypothetical protein
MAGVANSPLTLGFDTATDDFVCAKVVLTQPIINAKL